MPKSLCLQTVMMTMPDNVFTTHGRLEVMPITQKIRITSVYISCKLLLPYVTDRRNLTGSQRHMKSYAN